MLEENKCNESVEYNISTKCLYGDNIPSSFDGTGTITTPIYQTATYAHKGVGQSTGYDYSRLGNPTRDVLNDLVCSLEQGVRAFSFSSGMAAIATVMELFSPKDHIIASSDLYGGSIRLFNNISKKNGLEISFVDTSKEDISEYINSNTKAVYIETPTNPMMNITDIKKICKVAKEYNLIVIVDNTFLSPYFQNPLNLGADIVIHSGTKFLGGHNDTLAGFAVTNSNDIAQRLEFNVKTIGASLAPFDSWLIIRGIKTLAIRMEKGQENAIFIANWLKEHKKVKKVYYPGLKEHDGYEINKAQARGYGCMLTFEVDSKETALNVLESVKLIHFAESLGGVETLITYPTTQTHADVPEDVRIKNGVTDRILRISVGIEDKIDLIKDLEQALK